MGEATLVRHLLPALLGVLTPPAPAGVGSGSPIDASLLMGAVDVLEGLLPRLPASVVSRELLPPPPQPPSPLVAVVLHSATSQHSQPPPGTRARPALIAHPPHSPYVQDQTPLCRQRRHGQAVCTSLQWRCWVSWSNTLARSGRICSALTARSVLRLISQATLHSHRRSHCRC